MARTIRKSVPPSELSRAVSAAKSGAVRPPVVSVNQAQSWMPDSSSSVSCAALTSRSSAAERAPTSSVSWARRLAGSAAAAGLARASPAGSRARTRTAIAVASGCRRRAPRLRAAIMGLLSCRSGGWWPQRPFSRDPAQVVRRAWPIPPPGPVTGVTARGAARSGTMAATHRAVRARQSQLRRHLPWPSARPTRSTSSSSARAPVATRPPSAAPSWAFASPSSTRTRSAEPASTGAASPRRRSSSRPASTTA